MDGDGWNASINLNVDINYVISKYFVSPSKKCLLFSLDNIPCFLSKFYNMMFTSGRFNKVQSIDIFDQVKGKVKLDQFSESMSI